MGTLRVDATPRRALQDENVEVVVSGAAAGEEVLLTAELLDDVGVRWVSSCRYRVPGSGVVNLSTESSLEGGSFEGVHPMGLFWSMTPEKGSRPCHRYSKKKVAVPEVVTIVAAMAGDPTQKAQVEVERLTMAEGVERVEVTLSESGIHGALFIPCGHGRFPGVLDLFGSNPGLTEFRAAMLASRGFCSLALAYHGLPGLAATLADVDFSYFRCAVQWLCRHPRVSPGGIGIVGVSTGGMHSLWMTSILKDIKACVSINGLSLLYDVKPQGTIDADHPTPSPKMSCGEPMKDMIVEAASSSGGDVPRIMAKYGMRTENKPLGVDGENVTVWISREAAKRRAAMQPDLQESAHIELERNPGARYLFIVSGDDLNTDSPYFACLALERLRRYGAEGAYKNAELAMYAGAGHLIEPPHKPMTTHSFMAGYNVYLAFGGIAEAHAYAQEDSWKKILRVLRESLPPPMPGSSL